MRSNFYIIIQCILPILLLSRFVSILDVASIKPEAERSKCFSEETSRSNRNIFKNSTLMVDKAEQVAKNSLTSHCLDKKDNLRKSTSGDNCESNATNLAGKKTHVLDELSCTTSSGCSSKPDIPETCPSNNSQVLKRKGDIEFEMQLQMSLSATAVETTPTDSSINYSNEPSLNFPSSKKLKIVDEKSATSSHGISTAIGSSKVGSPLYWAEVYCNAENLTGKWVHVDAVNMVVDGEHKVEDLAAACKTSLRYVVAFYGHGAKDVTRRFSFLTLFFFFFFKMRIEQDSCSFNSSLLFDVYSCFLAITNLSTKKRWFR